MRTGRAGGGETSGDGLFEVEGEDDRASIFGEEGGQVSSPNFVNKHSSRHFDAERPELELCELTSGVEE